MTRRESFTFRTEWSDAIGELPEEYRLEAMSAIVMYATTGECPASIGGVVKAIMALIRPQIDRDYQLYLNGSRGGRPKPKDNQTETRPEPGNNQTETNQEPNCNQTETKAEPDGNQTEPKPNQTETTFLAPARNNSLSNTLSLDNNIISGDIDKDSRDTVERAVGDKKGGAGGKHPGKRFVKPSVEDIRGYCTERGNGVDAQRFYDFYESKGWVIGKNPMKDWKAAVRTWEQRREARPDYAPRSQIGASAPAESVYEQNERIKEELMKKYSGNGTAAENRKDNTVPKHA